MTDPPRSGDPEVLLAHAGWVRALARELARDPDRAAEVAQQSWLEALERPPRHQRALPAWLRSVVRNAARQLGRRESRRARREGSLPAAERAPSAAWLVEQAEMHREVVSAVLELPEPGRTTILLRYWHDRSPQEIAALLRVPAGTVRSRIHRAHGELRRRLDRRLGGDRGAWSALLLATEATRELSAEKLSATLGGVAMGWKLKLGLAAVIAAAAGGWAWRGAARAPSMETEAASAQVRSADAPQPLRLPSEERAGARLAQAPAERQPPPSAPSSAAIGGRVSAPDGSPIAGASITLHPEDAERELESLVQARSDAMGRFRIEPPAAQAGPIELEAAADGHRSARVQVVDRHEPVEITLPWAGVLVGHVREAETGQPIAGAAVLWREDSPAVTDAAGSYRLGKLPVSTPLALYARAQAFAEGAAHIELAGAGEVELDFALQRGTALVVEVFDAETGAAVAGAELRGDPSARPFARSDADGRGQLRFVAGRALFLHVSAEGYAPFVWSYPAEDAARALAPRIPLAPQATIEGVVTDAAGQGLAGVELHVHAQGGPFGRRSMSAEERAAHDLPGMAGTDGFFRTSARSDEQGRFLLRALPEPSRVVATLPDRASVRSEEIDLESARERRWIEIRFDAGGRILGRVLFNGAPVVEAEVRALSQEGADLGRTRSDAQGRYELRDLPEGTVELVALAEILGPCSPLPRVELAVQAGRSYEQDLAQEVELANISGKVRCASGAALAEVHVEARCDRRSDVGHYRFATRTGGDGSYRIDVPAGALYDLAASLHSLEWTRERVPAGASGVELVLPDLGRVSVQLVDAISKDPVLVQVESCFLGWREHGGGAFRRSFASFGHDGATELYLPAGVVDLAVCCRELGYAPATVLGVEVTMGPAQAVQRVELVRGFDVRFALRAQDGAEGGSLRQHEILLARSQPDQAPGSRSADAAQDALGHSAGPPCSQDLRIDVDDRGLARLHGLAPGRYALRSRPDDLVFDPQSLALTGDEELPIEIRWRRR